MEKYFENSKEKNAQRIFILIDSKNVSFLPSFFVYFTN